MPASFGRAVRYRLLNNYPGSPSQPCGLLCLIVYLKDSPQCPQKDLVERGTMCVSGPPALLILERWGYALQCLVLLGSKRQCHVAC